MRILLHSPKDTVVGTLAFVAVVAIVVNALFLQVGHHPSPMFGAKALPLPSLSPEPAATGPLPRPRPAAAPAADEGASTHSVAKHVAASPSSAHDDPVGDLIASSRRTMGVQRALTKFGYGQLKPTGNLDADTRAAIQRFERERKLPVTGKISAKLVHELSVMTGQPID
jgi:peptidoglycan hydrolase-like protein with peptidoglycan-binding domain